MRLSNGKMIPLSGIYLTVNALGGNATTSGRNAVANATQAAASGGVAIVNRSVVGPFPANEPAVAVDPNNSAHIIASANDYRFGDSQEGLYSALAGPFSFTDTVVQYVNSGPYYYNAAGDPSTGIDRSGTDYFGMLAFDRTMPGRSAVIVARSLPSATGLFVNRIPVAIDQQAATSGIFDDKDSLAVDNVLGSPSSGFHLQRVHAVRAGEQSDCRRFLALARRDVRHAGSGFEAGRCRALSLRCGRMCRRSGLDDRRRS